MDGANELAYHICGFVYEKDMPVMINFKEKWYCEGVIPACIGACNKSIGYPTWISKSDIYDAISAQGLIISAVSGYEKTVAVVDKVGHKKFSPTVIIGNQF